MNIVAYASEDENVEVKFTVNGKIMGPTVNIEGPQPVNISVSVLYPDEPNA
tara:strand:- start:2732 stop:2884 length:153 start_codon:yes stop_codon:yes gene_type:complete